MAAGGRKWRRPLFTIALVVMALLVIEGTVRLAVLLAPQSLRAQVLSHSERHALLQSTISTMLEDRRDSLAVFDSQLGWKPRAGLDNGKDVINAQGLRSGREYSPTADPATFRVAIFGDSFVYGSEVAGDEAWPSLLEQSRSALEVLNYGVPGYGPGQAYLRFLIDGGELSPDVVVMAISTPALSRIVTVSAAFRNPSPDFIAKPRFLLDRTGALELLPNPMQRLEDAGRYLDDPAAIHVLGEFDYWYEPWIHESALVESFYGLRLATSVGSKAWRRYLDDDGPLTGLPGRGTFNRSSKAFEILARLLDGFVMEARRRHVRPLVAILPDGYSVELSRQGLPAIMSPVREYCVEADIPFIDLAGAFLAQPASVDLDRLFFSRFHYSELGNEIVAERIGEWIDSIE